jgi:hypothetical protein
MSDFKKFFHYKKIGEFMMNTRMKFGGLFFSILLLLSGCTCEKCDSDKKESTSSVVAAPEAVVDSEVLVSIDGKPVLTVNAFQEFMQETLGADPQMQMMAQFMPDFEEQVFERGKLSGLTLEEWVKRNNIKADPEYKKMREQAEKALDAMLTQKIFIQKHVKEVSDSDAQKYYNENKAKDPNLMVAPDGVGAKGLSFETEVAAKEFYNKVNELKGDIEKAAKEMKKDVEDFGVVSQMSMIDPTVKEALLEVKTTPVLLSVIKAGDKEFWVVKALDKQKAQYAQFEQVQDRIKESLMNKKIEGVFEAKIPEYQKEYGFVVNHAYFENKKKEKEEQQAKMLQAMKEEKAQQEKQAPSSSGQKELAQANPMQKAA